MITKSFDTNVKGVLLCSKEVMKLMIDNSIDGHIININRWDTTCRKIGIKYVAVYV